MAHVKMTYFSACLSLLFVIGFFHCRADEGNRISPGPAAPGFDLYGSEWDDDALEMSDIDELRDMVPGFEKPSARASGAKTDVPLLGSSGGGEGARNEDEPRMAYDLYYGDNYEVIYHKMNEFLKRELETDDFDQNMEKLAEWHEKEKAAGVTVFTRGLVEGLSQILPLAKIGSLKCSQKSLEILAKNDRATGGRARRPPSQLWQVRRIDWLVNQAMRAHAQQCKPVYLRRYQQLLKTSLDESTRERVRIFADSVLREMAYLNRQVDSNARSWMAELIYGVIRRQSGDDPDARFLERMPVAGQQADESARVNGPGIATLVYRYVIMPCREYRRVLGPRVFLAAGFDAPVMERDERLDYPANSKKPAVADFLRGWKRFDICDQLLRQNELTVMEIVAEYALQKTA